MKKFILFAFIILVSVSLLFGAAPVLEVKILRAEARGLAKQGARWLEIDTDNDGKIDHAMLLAANGDKIYEEIDYNHDGEMDDLCYYEKGALVREETDTNFDGRIDLWVFLKNGIYVERYMRDTNHDGVVDLVKEYGPQK